MAIADIPTIFIYVNEQKYKKGVKLSYLESPQAAKRYHTQ